MRSARVILPQLVLSNESNWLQICWMSFSAIFPISLSLYITNSDLLQPTTHIKLIKFEQIGMVALKLKHCIIWLTNTKNWERSAQLTGCIIYKVFLQKQGGCAFEYCSHRSKSWEAFCTFRELFIHFMLEFTHNFDFGCWTEQIFWSSMATAPSCFICFCLSLLNLKLHWFGTEHSLFL